MFDQYGKTSAQMVRRCICHRRPRTAWCSSTCAIQHTPGSKTLVAQAFHPLLVRQSPREPHNRHQGGLASLLIRSTATLQFSAPHALRRAAGRVRAIAARGHVPVVAGWWHGPEKEVRCVLCTNEYRQHKTKQVKSEEERAARAAIPAAVKNTRERRKPSPPSGQPVDASSCNHRGLPTSGGAPDASALHRVPKHPTRTTYLGNDLQVRLC